MRLQYRCQGNSTALPVGAGGGDMRHRRGITMASVWGARIPPASIVSTGPAGMSTLGPSGIAAYHTWISVKKQLAIPDKAVCIQCCGQACNITLSVCFSISVSLLPPSPFPPPLSLSLSISLFPAYTHTHTCPTHSPFFHALDADATACLFTCICVGRI
jgi:hypothetical protein